MRTCKRLFACLAIVVSLQGCGGGKASDGDVASAQPNDQRKALRSTAANANNAASSPYFDADWLYDQYIAPHNPPLAAKAVIMVDMQRLANGFQLQQSQGEDIDASTAHFHNAVSSVAGQIFLSTWAADMQNPSLLAQFNGAAGTRPPPTSPARRELALSLAEESMRSQAMARDADARLQLKEIFIRHRLPYDLSGSATPWIVWNQSSTSSKKGGGGGSGGGGGGGGGSPVPLTHGTQNWAWITGDVLYVEWNIADNPNINLNPFGHIALIDRNNSLNPATAIDAHPANPGGGVFRWSNINSMADRFRFAQGHHMSIEYFRANYGANYWGQYYDALSPMSGARYEAVEAARSWVGTLNYSLFTNKGSDAKTYCSLLVYAAYKKASNVLQTSMYWKYHPYGWLNTLDIDLDIDFDSDGGLFVFPRDILQSPWVQAAFAISDRRSQPGGGGGGGGGGGSGHNQDLAIEQLQWPIRRE